MTRKLLKKMLSRELLVSTWRDDEFKTESTFTDMFSLLKTASSSDLDLNTQRALEFARPT